jgi:hypothetical protein
MTTPSRNLVKKAGLLFFNEMSHVLASSSKSLGKVQNSDDGAKQLFI